MQPILLIINSGSSSIKFAVYSAPQLDCLQRGQIQGIGVPGHCFFKVEDQTGNRQSQHQDKIGADNHRQALHFVMQWLTEHLEGFQLQAVGHRIVHGGHQFNRPLVIDDAVLQQLESLIPLAPLHQPHNLAAVKILRQSHPSLTQIACFDTAFHHSRPQTAQLFALPRQLFDEGVRSYGFHGLSYEYIASILPSYTKTASTSRTIIAHLGQGASLCALQNGKSRATTMTFTPLDGLVMGTRCGSIDPACILYLLREKQLSVEAISDLLHFQSGLLGLSGISNDMQVLLNSQQPDAHQAIEVFVYRIVREIGAMAATIQGLDHLVFTAGIGENADLIREKICRQLGWLGVEIDIEANQQHASKISTPQSLVSAWVIATNEEKMIATHTYSLAMGEAHEPTS